MPNKLWNDVAQVLQRAAEQVLLPHYGTLKAPDVAYKAAGEPVSIADREAEEFISRELLRLTPGAAVVGEEACAETPALLDSLKSGTAWLIDPIDGTGNFVAGKGPFAIMVAFLEEGLIAGSAIHHPLTGTSMIAQSGGGAWMDGERLRTPARRTPLGKLRGIVSSAFVPPEQMPHVRRVANAVEAVEPTQRCAGFEYPQVALGQYDFAIYWRTLAWDHAPGALLLREAGGTVTHLDGADYEPAKPRPGLLLARTPEIEAELLELFAKSTC